MSFENKLVLGFVIYIGICLTFMISVSVWAMLKMPCT